MTPFLPYSLKLSPQSSSSRSKLSSARWVTDARTPSIAWIMKGSRQPAMATVR